MPQKRGSIGESEMNRAKIYRQAIWKWGKNLQMLMAIEEMSELQKEICKVIRGTGLMSRVNMEMADTEIMLEQLKVMFDNSEEVAEEKSRKLKRLLERLKVSK